MEHGLDLLPEEELLNLAITNKQINLSVETQKEITSILLDNLLHDKTEKDKIFQCTLNTT